MTYRMFGETGEKISSLGFGCMRLPEVEQDGVWSIDDEKAKQKVKDKQAKMRSFIKETGRTRRYDREQVIQLKEEKK